MQLPSLLGRVVVLLAVTALPASTVAGQTSAASRVGAPAKALLGDAKTEARKWRSDAYVIQIVGRGVTDGVAMWYYDFHAPGASGKKCLRVNFGKNKQAFTQQLECETEPEIKDFVLDSDKAVDIARKEGLTRPQLNVILTMAPTSAGPRAIWILMEGNGMKEGDLTIDIDAQTGAIRGKRKL